MSAARNPILVVDDDARIRDLLNDHLAVSGYRVAVATNGAEALVALVQNRPALVLLDIRLPTLDGIDVLRRMRELDPGVIVIMITGADDEDLWREALRYGAFDYLTKPVDLQHLDRAVTSALALKKQYGPFL